MKIKILTLSLLAVILAPNSFAQTSALESGSFSEAGVRYNWTLNQMLIPDTFTNSTVHQILGINSLPQGADYAQYYQAYITNLSNSTYINKKEGANLAPFLIGNGLVDSFPDESERIAYINNNFTFYTSPYTIRDVGLILANGWLRTNLSDGDSTNDFADFVSGGGYSSGRRVFALDDPWFYWYSLSMLLGPSATDTLASLRPNALALRSAFNLQSSKITQGLTYDCTVYDQKNICVSFVGSKSDGKGFDATTGALILAHKPTSNFRFGGYIDQSAGSSTSAGLTLQRGSPGFGAFGVWSQNADGSGVEVRASANVGKLDMETTRTAVDSAEAGFGKSDIKSSGFQLEVSRDYAINNAWSARPYLGYRKTTNKRAGYAETDAVEAPLTYNSLKQNTETALAGVRFGHQFSQKTALTLSAGLEHDLKNNVDRYQATNADISDIDSIDMASNKRKTRPVMAFSLNHNLDKTQRIGVSVTHRKEAFESGSSTSAMGQYSVGF